MTFAAMLETLFGELRGIRRALLTLAMLFFVIMLLEVDLGHRPVLARAGILASFGAGGLAADFVIGLDGGADRAVLG